MPDKPLKKMTKVELIEVIHELDSRTQTQEKEAQRRQQGYETRMDQQRIRIAGLEGEVQVLGALGNDLTELVEASLSHADGVFHWEPNDFNSRTHSKTVRQQQEQLRDVHQRAERQRQRNHERLSTPVVHASDESDEGIEKRDLVGESRRIVLSE